jgi:hypothetical protein
MYGSEGVWESEGKRDRKREGVSEGKKGGERETAK